MNTKHHTPWVGYFYGFLGISTFAFTLPLTRVALQSFSPYFITVGRVVIAGLLGALILVFRKASFPERKHWIPLLAITGGVAIGFPLFIAFALQQTQASHAAIVLAILPLLTALLGAWLHHERHKPQFWIMALSGCATVFVYLIHKNGIILEWADLWVLGAALSAAVGYVVGARVSLELGGVNTICWALVAILPLSLPLSVFLLMRGQDWNAELTLGSLLSFFYLATMSQLLGFVPWYLGLRKGGIAKVSQIQLLQTFLTLLISAIVLREEIHLIDWLVAAVIVAQVYVAKKLG